MNRRIINVVASVAGFALVLQALPAGAAQFKAHERVAEPGTKSVQSQPADPPEPVPAVPAPTNADWDPKDPAAVQYADGAWGIVYNDAAIPPNLFFRRSLSGAE